MKKKPIPVMCVILLFCLFSLSACGEDKSYLSNVDEYIPDYKSAVCNIMKGRDIELHIESSVSNSREEIADIFDVLQNDYSRLNSVFGLNTKITCYVISDESFLGDEKAAYQNNALLCTRNSINNGSYRRLLTAAYIRSTEIWKQYGADAYAFGNEYNNNALKKYYESGNDLELTLFQAYFIKAFSDNTDIAICTACSFGDFVIGNYGFEKFMAADSTEYRKEYLNCLGIDRAFEIPYDLSWLDGAEYSRDFLSYSLVIKTANRTYYLDPIPAERDTASFDTPERVLYHLSAGNAECNKILNYIRENAPASYPFVSEKYSGRLEYYISGREIKTCSDADNRRIYLLDPSEYVHETIHAVTLQSNPSEEAWIGEGVAEYLSRYVSRHISDINNRFYLSFTDKSVTGNISVFAEEVNALYKSRGGSFESMSDFDFALLEECIGETTLKNNAYKSQIEFPYATTPIYKTYSVIGKDGKTLTYPEAYAFTNYLIEKYGFDKVLECCINYDLEGTFGAGYSDLNDGFLKSLSP